MPAPVLFLACVASLAVVPPAWPENAAPAGAPPDSTTGSFASSPPAAEIGWGPLPPPSDSTTAVVEDRGMPVWEHAIVWPYRVVTFPVRLAVDGLGQGVIFLDRHYVIQRVGRLLSPPVAPFGFEPEVSVGGTGGFGAGLTFRHDQFPGRGSRFRIGFEASLHGSHSVHVSLQRGRLESGAGYRLSRAARFYGIGPAAKDGNESFYSQETSWGGLAYGVPLPGRARLRATAIYSTAGARGADERNVPALSEKFRDDLPAGYGHRSDGVSLGMELHSAAIKETARPLSGTIAAAKAVYFAATDRISPDFWTYRGEIEQFLPLWFSYRALALRGVISWTDPAGPAAVPFQRLLTNDDPDLLRGYRDMRWRDKGLVLFTAEYRWPVWVARDAAGPGVDAYLFTDVGQVFGRFGEITAGNLTTSWGGGLRLAARRGFAGRIELASGGEGLRIRLAASQVFQQAGSHLLRGKSPVPER